MPEGNESQTQEQIDAAAAATAAAAAEAEAGKKATSEQQEDPFADLDNDTRDWIKRSNLTPDVKALAKKAYEQEKLIGGAVKLPGKDATDEERAAFFNKLGRPEKEDGYELTVPKELPEDLPYDGERAKSFKSIAHKLGLSAEQAKGVHDWAVANAVTDHTAAKTAGDEQALATAKAETDKLVKEFGPLDGDTFKAQAEFADRVLTQTPGGLEVIEEFKRIGLIGSGEGKIVQSAPTFKWLANLGMAFFKEAESLRGSADMIGNPFADGESFNLTKQGQLLKADRGKALSLIAAAGKKPSDFGISA